MQRRSYNRSGSGLLVAGVFLAAACVRKPAPSPDSASGAPAPAPPVATADSAVAIELRTDRTSYRAGDNATLTIVNHTRKEWTFNPCTRTLERESGTAWQVVPEGRMCTMEAWILGPNATRTAPTSFGASLDAGRYRLVIAFASAGGPRGTSVRATSAPVTIAK
ncbi:MAG TPA: immunoglobulin-like domain-containing protein [Gemmatimonadaceae bacterium]|nr:immunoglobulin-like domain-containing protein [Gemmatimonadaceae bacterium]